jgi:hypothetical protein
MMGRRRRNFRARGFEGRRDLASSLTSLGFVAILLLASTVEGEARCKHYTGRGRMNVHAGILSSPPPCRSPDDCDRKAYGESGARGRLGLGADPAHPEGPGNPSD